jgi:DNA repair exonuclease SbcCD ATPase subunit
VELTTAEARVALVERQLDELARTSVSVDDRMQALADRQRVIDAVRETVEAVHDVSARSKADLDFVAGHRDEIAAVRQQFDTLLATAADADDKILSLEERRKTIEAAHAKANVVANLLEDVRINLESIGEQKALVDHVGVKLARLEFVMQEAQSTHRALQHERELAERIELSIAQVRTRTALPSVGSSITST